MMSNPDSYPRCGNCDHFNEHDYETIEHFDGYCDRLKQDAYSGFEVKEDFGCVLHSSIQNDD